MIYNLYYLDQDNKKLVRTVDDIHENNVWAVSQIWGTAIHVVAQSQMQPDDANQYTVIGG